MRTFAWLLIVLVVPFLSACGGTGKGEQEKVLAMVNGQRPAHYRGDAR
jgi:hypothetical protein